MTLYSLLQLPFLLALALVVLVIGTPSETGMTEIEEASVGWGIPNPHNSPNHFLN